MSHRWEWLRLLAGIRGMISVGWRLLPGTKKKKLNSFIPPLSNVHIVELEMWGWGVCRGSPAYYYTLDRPTIPLLPCPCLKQMNPRWVMVSVCLGVKCMMNYAHLMVVLQITPALHCHLWFPVCSLRAGNMCAGKSVSPRVNPHAWPITHKVF